MQCLYLITQHRSWTPEHMLYQLVLKMVVLLTLPITVCFSQSFTFDWLCKLLCWPSHFSSHPFPTHTYPSSILVINLLYICFIHRPIQKWGFLSLSLAKDDINHTLTSAKDCAAAAMRGSHGQQANIGGICKAWLWLWQVLVGMKPWTSDGENQYYLLSVFLSSSLSRKATKSV